MLLNIVLKLIGYNYITRQVNVISAIFGISEKELLRAAIQGKQELLEILNTNIKEKGLEYDFLKCKFVEINLPENLFETLAFNIGLLHTAIYNPNKMNELDQEENILNAIKKIYDTAEIGLNHRIENLDENDLNDLKNKLERIKLDQNAITEIIEDFFLGTEHKEQIRISSEHCKKMVYTKILSIDSILNNCDKPQDLIRFIKTKEDQKEIVEFMKENNIPINEEIIQTMSEIGLSDEMKNQWVKEYCLDGEEWDNSSIIEYIHENRNKIGVVKSLKYKIKDSLKNPFKKPQKSLGERTRYRFKIRIKSKIKIMGFSKLGFNKGGYSKLGFISMV